MKAESPVNVPPAPVAAPEPEPVFVSAPSPSYPAYGSVDGADAPPAFDQSNMDDMFADVPEPAVSVSTPAAASKGVASLFGDDDGGSSTLFAAPPAAVAPVELEMSEDELHMDRLRQFFAANRPDNVPRVAELYGKLGKQIWVAMEGKYPGKTAAYTHVSVQCVIWVLW